VNTLQGVIELYSHGWMPIPIPAGQKHPILKGWQNLRLSKEDLPRYFSNGQNVGLLLGEPSLGLVDVDCDWKESAFLAPRFLPTTGMISGRESSPKSHYWFIAPGVKTKQFIDPTESDERNMIVELRSTGGQTLVAPSVHPSGECYIWHEFTDPARIEPEQLQNAVASIASCSLFARHWQHGSRHNIALAVAGGLLRAGWTLEQVKAFISNAAEAAHDEEIQDRILAVETTYERLRTNQSATGIPTLKELIDPRLVCTLSKWLGLSQSVFSEDAKEKRASRASIKAPSMFQVSDRGVHAVDPTSDKEETFICSKLVIAAATRNKDSEDWGRLLEFSDLDGQKHCWAMPMSLLAGEGSDYRSHLLSMGLTIAPSRKARELLTIYIQTASPDDRVRCVDRVGWYEGAFVLPDVTFGNGGNEQVFFQSATGSHHNLRVGGSLSDWQENVARYCVGNSRLVFGVSCAFAGVLLQLTGEGGGGFHIRGLTSTGKSTLQLVAGSVWGGGSSKGYLQSWRTTINGLEAIAELHNHGLLCLDEIEQCDPREVGEIAYMLANGIGKARMTRSIVARKKLEWDLIFLSSGERALSDLVESVGKRARGGQEVRMCDLEADAGEGLGIFENLHGFRSPGELALHLSEASKLYYGSAIRAYLPLLVQNRAAAAKAMRNFRNAFIAENVPDGASGEVIRAASRFAVVAAAGESAEEVTGWPEGEARRAAATMFKSWLAGRGTKGSSDMEAAIRQVRAFIESHGASRFQSDGDEEVRVINRVGFKRKDETDGMEYLILPEAFKKEVCAGYDYRAVAKALVEHGYLKAGKGKHLGVVRRLPEFGRTYVYAIKSDIITSGDDSGDGDDT
jgi:putative DNA primase/helicase